MTGETADDLPLAEQFWSVARTLRGQWRASLGAWDISPSQFRALGTLRRSGPLRPGALSERLHIAPRSATEVIDALEAAGLARRHADPADRRATLVELTDAGRETADQVRAAQLRENSAYFERLSATDRRALARILRKLAPD